MAVTDYLLSVVRGERRGPGPSLLRAGLAVLSHVYNVGLGTYLLPYRLGIRKRARLACPVVSIGNLTVGGTGKTPMTQRLCAFLSQRGLKVCVLSRGYRGGNERGVAVVSDGKRTLLDAREAGDEAALLAGLLPGVPVVVGKDRRESGKLAVERFAPDVVVLDDGMQFYQLHRDLDIVLLDAQRPFDNGWTFPRGLMREPPSHLRRAGCIVITNSDRVEARALSALRKRISQLAPGRPIYASRIEPYAVRALDRSVEHTPDWLRGRRVAAICALGSPHNFRTQLELAGAEILHWTEFPDHHEPTIGELNDTIAAACAMELEAVIVTEKDAVKLPPMMRPLPFFALRVRTALDDEAGFFSHALRALR